MSVLQKDIHRTFIEHVRRRRAGKIDAVDDSLFNGDVLTGRMAAERGLIDGIGELRAVMRARYGDNVRLRMITAERRRPLWARLPLTTPRPADLVTDLADWLEARLLWSRFGLIGTKSRWVTPGPNLLCAPIPCMRMNKMNEDEPINAPNLARLLDPVPSRPVNLDDVRIPKAGFSDRGVRRDLDRLPLGERSAARIAAPPRLAAAAGDPGRGSGRVRRAAPMSLRMPRAACGLIARVRAEAAGLRGLMSFQSLIADLQKFWARQGCVILQPYDVEVGAGTFHPATALRALGPEPWRAAYVQPSRRPTDGRYGENPNRLQQYDQLQVILKPAPTDSQDLYLASLTALGIDARRHDIRFVEDDWRARP